MSAENLNRLARQLDVHTPYDLIKHICTLHDGEVRVVGEERWLPFPAYGEIHKACYWHFQTMSKDGAPNEDMLLMFVFE